MPVVDLCAPAMFRRHVVVLRHGTNDYMDVSSMREGSERRGPHHRRVGVFANPNWVLIVS